MAKKLITKEQEKFLKFFKANALKEDFYLTGGTALALFYYQHRRSEDLDFFTAKDVPIKTIEKFIKDARQSLRPLEISYNKSYDRRIYQFKFQNGNILKIEFTYYPFKNLRKPKNTKGIMADSLLDIGANKIMSVMDRYEPKDFFDLYFIKKDYRLENLRTAAQKKFGIKIDSLALSSRFNKVENLKIIPQMIKKVDIEDLKEYFKEFNRKRARTFLV